jgi:hypothetical protein
MSLTFTAQNYLAAWDARRPIDGGLTHGERLQDFNLDYSWDSLERIDAFLDELRTRFTPRPEIFLDDTANTNLLYLLGFYVGEVRGRVAGVVPQWVNWDELLQIDPGMRLFGEGFHSSAVMVAPGLFLPLVSIASRLFEGPDDKSVAFSAGVELGSGSPGIPSNQPLPPLPPQSLVRNFPAAFETLRARTRLQYLQTEWPEWFATDPMDRLRKDLPLLLRTGRVVWGAIVQANNGLFDGSVSGAGAEVLYDPEGKAPLADLRSVAHSLFSLKAKEPSDATLRSYANHLRDEYTRVFHWHTPPSLLPYSLAASSTFIHAARLPGGRLVFPFFPLLISDECLGSVIIAPWELWPKDVFAQWADALKEENPFLGDQPSSPPDVRAPTPSEVEEGDRLYAEGLAFWHGNGIPRDEARARHCWEKAAALDHYLALDALGFLIENKDQQTYADNGSYLADLEQMADCHFRAWAIAEYRLGFVEAAKLHLRPGGIRPDDQYALKLLGIAADLGDKHAAQMLVVLKRFRS